LLRAERISDRTASRCGASEFRVECELLAAGKRLLVGLAHEGRHKIEGRAEFAAEIGERNVGELRHFGEFDPLEALFRE
jgi:hypothetical protein